jgi:class 3 adenylate cyclase
VYNAGRHDHIRACVGLGFGEVLLVPGTDLYGPEVNRAFVLGEDVANGGELLVTEAFLAALGGLPDGIGAHRAPADREAEAGFGFHVLRDHR